MSRLMRDAQPFKRALMLRALALGTHCSVLCTSGCGALADSDSSSAASGAGGGRPEPGDETGDAPAPTEIGLSFREPVRDASFEDFGPCAHAPSEYRGDERTCTTQPFACEPPSGVFVDGCGCGCEPSAAMLSESNDRDREPATPELCPGPGGAMAVLERAFQQIALSADSVYLIATREGPGRGPSNQIGWVWRLDKRTRQFTLVTLDEVAAARGGVVAEREGRQTYQVDGREYFAADGFLLRHEESGSDTRLLELPDRDDQAMAFIVAGADFYATSSAGVLWHARLSPELSELTILERRGPYDDDDYDPLLGADDEAVYWQASGDVSMSSEDDDRLTLFRTCRSGEVR